MPIHNNDFYKLVIFEKQRHCGPLQSELLYERVQCNTGSCCVHRTGGINIYLYLYVRLLIPVCQVCLYG